MKTITVYKCEICGESFYVPENCERHELQHKLHETANIMLNQGKTLGEIQAQLHYWPHLSDETLKKVKKINKDNCFIIPYWQCCNKPAYCIKSIDMDGKLFLSGCGSWDGYYGSSLCIESHYLLNPRPKDELFRDPRYK